MCIRDSFLITRYIVAVCTWGLAQVPAGNIPSSCALIFIPTSLQLPFTYKQLRLPRSPDNDVPANGPDPLDHPCVGVLCITFGARVRIQSDHSYDYVYDYVYAGRDRDRDTQQDSREPPFGTRIAAGLLAE